MSSYGDEDLKETTLSPEVRRIRNSIIKKFAHEPLDIMAKFVKDVVDNEEDTIKRLGAMAARVEILRMRISQISGDSDENSFDGLTDEVMEEIDSPEETSNEIVITSPNLSDWVRLRIIENSEINGVRFPKGVVIDVSQEDGDRLLESGKASYVEEDEISDVKSNLSSQTKSKPEVIEENMESADGILMGEDTLGVEQKNSDDALVTEILEDESSEEELEGSEPSLNSKNKKSTIEKVTKKKGEENIDSSSEALMIDDNLVNEQKQSDDASVLEVTDGEASEEELEVNEANSNLKNKKLAREKVSKNKTEDISDSSTDTGATITPEPSLATNVDTSEDMLAGFEIEADNTKK